jgi:type II secretory pathway pseudopilin PulG
MKLNFLPKKSLPGFTLIEMIVVFSIVIVMSGIVLFNYQSSQGNNLAKETSYNIMGILRSAASGGRSASQSDLYTDSTILQPAVGVVFSLDLGTGIVNTIELYKSGYAGITGRSRDDTILEKFSVQSRSVKIVLCKSVDYTTGSCTPYIPGAGDTMPSIEFGRLSSEPIIEGTYDQNIAVASSPALMVQSTGDTKQTKFIVIERTGNIFIR